MKKEDSLAKELQILKEAIRFAQAGNEEGVAEKFIELCAHQHNVMEQEAHDATTEVIRTAQRYARCKTQSRPDEGIEGKPSQEDHKGKES